MSRRLFPHIFLQPWGLEGRDTRCPRCHVHRFDWLVPDSPFARLAAGECETAFGSGQCRRCCWRGSFNIDAEMSMEWYVWPLRS